MTDGVDTDLYARISDRLPPAAGEARSMQDLERERTQLGWELLVFRPSA